ncbi:response regulator [Hazenella sp. IB182357]|uniref:Response regulator n=1 Tax=Polycladospora coralii TaxID=2771432 RepID=A0A926NC38_9BACL|nr:response regulator [Polycladospora coralii]MBD1373527.1 response regulator [Polycladospora coralii]
MIRTLLVEDEEIERLALEDILTKHVPEIEVIGALENGLQAIERIKKDPPDLILVDIQMPGKNGLDVIAYIQAHAPQIKAMIVSSYDRFSYAQEALRMGVKDYLLKPSSVSDIVQAIKKVCNEIESEQEKQTADHQILSILKADFVMQILHHYTYDHDIDPVFERFQLKRSQQGFVLTLHLDNPNTQLYHEIKQAFHAIEHVFVGALSGAHIPIIAFTTYIETNYRHITYQIMKKVQVRPEVTFIAIGTPYDQLHCLRHSYYEAMQVIHIRSSQRKFQFYEDFIQHDLCLLQRNLQEDIWEKIRIWDWQALEQAIFQFLYCEVQTDDRLDEVRQNLLRIFSLISFQLEEQGVLIDLHTLTFTGQSLSQLQVEIQTKIALFKHLMRHTQQNQALDVAHQFKKYIDQHYHEEISLQDLAHQYQLSAYYISKRFKEAFNMNYVDYLTDLRIKEAKRLIRAGKKSMKQICFAVGYHDPNYFSRVFKKMCGLTPTQYKKT